MNNITLGVVTTGREDAVKILLGSLIHLDNPIILIDNGENSLYTQPVVAVLLDSLSDRLTYVRVAEKQNLIHNKSELINRCTTEYLMFLDDDMIPLNLQSTTEAVLAHKPDMVTFKWSYKPVLEQGQLVIPFIGEQGAAVMYKTAGLKAIVNIYQDLYYDTDGDSIFTMGKHEDFVMTTLFITQNHSESSKCKAIHFDKEAFFHLIPPKFSHFGACEAGFAYISESQTGKTAFKSFLANTPKDLANVELVLGCFTKYLNQDQSFDYYSDIEALICN